MRKAVFTRLLEETPPREMPPQEADKFYSYGFSLYGAGKAKEAAEVFEVLCAQMPMMPKFWFALASCFQESGEYERALRAWMMAAILKDEDPYPYFHAAECCLSLSQKEEAHKALNSAAMRAGEGHPLMDKIGVLREQWK